jgi:hypothetical protein
MAAPLLLAALVGAVVVSCSTLLGIEEATVGGGGTGGSGVTVSCTSSATCGAGRQCLGGQCCATPPAGGSCNLPSCGCAAGQVCYPRAPASGLGCFPSDDLRAGEDCTDSFCAPGLGCFGRVCKPYCQTDADCPTAPGLRSCRDTFWGDPPVAIPGVRTCARICDPAWPHSPRGALLACPDGFGCDWDDNGLWSNCGPAGTDGQGVACSSFGECEPGYYCSGTTYTCNRICGEDGDCGGGTCNDFTPPVRIGGWKVGFCALL